MECPNQCGDTVRAEELVDHMQRCMYRSIPCGADCNACKRQLKSWLFIPAKAVAVAAAAAAASRADDSNSAGEAGEGKVQYEIGGETLYSQVACDIHGETALTWAARHGDSILLAHIVEVVDKSLIDHETDGGETALTKACLYGHKECVEILLDNGANINYETARGITPLMNSVRGGHLNIVEYLMDAYVQIDYVNRHGRTALQWAEQWKRRDEIADALRFNLKMQNAHHDLIVSINMGDYDAVRKAVGTGDPYEFNQIGNLRSKLDDFKKRVAKTRDEIDQLKTELKPLEDPLLEIQGKLDANETDARRRLEDAQTIAEKIRFMEAHAAENQARANRMLGNAKRSEINALRSEYLRL